MQQQRMNKQQTKLDSILEQVTGPDALVFSCKVFLYFLIMIAGCFFIIQDTGWQNAVGSVLIGSMFAHGVELSHQALHGTGFKSAKLSRCIGFIMCMPMLISFRAYQLSHLRHHAFVGTEDDTEFFEFNVLDKNTSLLRKLVSFTMLSHYFHFFSRVFDAARGITIYDYLPENLDKQCRREYLVMFAVLVMLVSASIYHGSQAIVFFWLVPLLFVAGPLHTIIELPEHIGCDQTTKSIYKNTRSIISNRIMTWFVNGNNYHVEHHMYPLVRPESAAIIHEHIKERISNKNSSYRDFIRTIFKA